MALRSMDSIRIASVAKKQRTINYFISPVGAGHNLIIDILVVVEVLEAEVEDAVRAGSGDGGQAEEDDQLCEGGPGQYGKQLDIKYSTMC